MKKLLLPISLILVLLLTAFHLTACSSPAKKRTFPRLGETTAECEKHCGKPVQPPTETGAQYHNGEFIIKVTFWNGKASRLTYAKSKSKPPLFDRTPLSEAERESLLKDNDGGSTWNENVGASDNEMTLWSRADDNAEASYEFSSGLFLVQDVAYRQYLNDQKGN